MSRRLVAGDEVRVGFVGNSIQYFNDLPRVLEALAERQGIRMATASCYRPGASLACVLAEGNGMEGYFPAGEEDFATVREVVEAAPDVVVLNDYTQAPARPKSRAASLQTLDEYAALLRGKTPVLLATYAYRAHAKGSDDIGSTPGDFTAKLVDGYRAYADRLSKAGLSPVLADAASAFLAVHDERPDLWWRLFYVDDFHPSPSGTLLQAYLLHCLLFDAPPPVPENKRHIAQLWTRARYMQPPGDAPPCSLPTVSDAKYLRDLAVRVSRLQHAATTAANKKATTSSSSPSLLSPMRTFLAEVWELGLGAFFADDKWQVGLGGIIVWLILLAGVLFAILTA